MFMIIAALVILAPPFAILLTMIAGAALIKTRKLLGLGLLSLTSLLSLLLIWEFRYDLGLPLPELDWLPSGAESEMAMFVMAAAILALLMLATFSRSEDRPRRWLTVVPAIIWALVLGAAFMLGQVDFSH